MPSSRQQSRDVSDGFAGKIRIRSENVWAFDSRMLGLNFDFVRIALRRPSPIEAVHLVTVHGWPLEAADTAVGDPLIHAPDTRHVCRELHRRQAGTRPIAANPPTFPPARTPRGGRPFAAKRCPSASPSRFFLVAHPETCAPRAHRASLAPDPPADERHHPHAPDLTHRRRSRSARTLVAAPPPPAAPPSSSAPLRRRTSTSARAAG